MWLFTLVFFNLIYYLYGTNMCQSSCNDGGCAYTNKAGVYKGCDCGISNEHQTGNECESYVNACTKDPVCDNGMCVTLMGNWYCDCPNNYYGVKCTHYDNSEYV